VPLPCVFLILATLLLGAFAAPALGATVTERPLLFKFQTGQSTARNLTVDDSSGAVYVAENQRRGPQPPLLSRFHADGTPWPFPATGNNTIAIPGNGPAIAVDNSGGPTQGRFYVGPAEGEIYAFDPNGELLWKYKPRVQPEDLAVDSTGDLWSFERFGGVARKYEISSFPPVESLSYQVGEMLHGDVDRIGNIYKLYTELSKWEAGSMVWERPGFGNGDFAVDQSTSAGRIFETFSDKFVEVEQDGTEVGSYGQPFLSGDEQEFGSEARGIGYLPSSDRVYVYLGRRTLPDEETRPLPTVLVFGPSQTGTVPDLALSTPSEIGVSSARFAGTVNPQGTESEWYFEWKKKGFNWDAAESSPPQSLPSDSTDHTVEFTPNSLRGNTEYDVRLVAVNSSSKLRNFSSTASFTTETAAAEAVVTINPASEVTTESAKITGTLDPEGDTADWRVQLSTDPTCSEGFADQDLQQISPATTVPQPVAYELGELLPSEHYCVRIAATNSAGSSTSPIVELTTDPIAATSLETIGVAPRLDTRARLNALVNPQGEDLSYRFEYSSDGGANWVDLPQETDQSGARKPIVISSAVSGLQPATSYIFRVTIENPVESSTSSTRSFTTRSTAEVTLPQIGYELVNNPDKGNQNLFPFGNEDPLSTDGERAIWEVTGGAPGGYNGTGAIFLAERTALGWHSRSLLPPPSEQPGGGTYEYRLGYHTPDMSRFLLAVGRPNLHGLGEAPDTTFVRLDAHQHQEILHKFERDMLGIPILASTDALHGAVVEGGPAGRVGPLLEFGSGTLKRLSIMPGGSEAECGIRPADNSLIATTDASVVYFATQENGDCAGPKRLYARNRHTEETINVDPGSELGSPEFIRATPDGREAYFETWSQLDPNDRNTDKDIYRWSLDSGAATCVTCLVPDAQVSFAKVSDDFSRIYFDSQEVLIPGQGSRGKENIYTLKDGDLKYVTTTEGINGGLELSSDGRTLVFGAEQSPSLTSDKVAATCYENPQQEATGTGGCTQLYRYEVGEESIDCLTCVQGGLTNWRGANAVNGGLDMSSDGSVVVFRTRQALLPRDINRRMDLYEWRNGSLRLVTDGTTDFPDEGQAVPVVRAVTADGGSILFTAPEPGLTGYEQDGLANMYVARVGGGFPRPTSSTHCSEESCQGPLQTPPLGQTASSEALHGAGNIQVRRGCPEESIRRHGRCVHRRRKKHKRHAKRHRNHRQGAKDNGRGAK
jgi:hypothetical protein